jgi:hypothetical protein
VHPNIALVSAEGEVERQGHGRKFRELRYVVLGRRSQRPSISNARYLARHRVVDTLPMLGVVVVGFIQKEKRVTLASPPGAEA